MKNRAFSLVEILIAMALAGLIMLASSNLLLSITDLWIKEEALDDFQDHVQGVGVFIQNHVKENLYHPKNWIQQTGFASPPIGGIREAEETLFFTVNAPHSLFPDIKSGLIRCYLNFTKDQGLSIIYHKLFANENENKVPILKQTISAYATGIRYLYYNEDNQTWDEKEITNKKNNKTTTPDFIKILFKKEETEDSLYIPLYASFKEGITLI